MAGYFGTDIQMRLQQRSDESADWTRTTPGACHIARMLGADDLDRLGSDTILEILKEDGAFGFRMIPAERAEALAESLGKRGYRVDFWDVFMAERAEALTAADAILDRPLPDGLEPLDLDVPAESPAVRRVQEFVAAQGIAPFSASMLVGEIAPATTVALADPTGAIVATAHAYRPHNQFSRFHDAAWGGLVAVAVTERGKKLGSSVNAMMVRAAFDRLGAERIYELASATNLPSRRMIESCGLRLEPSLKCGNATALKEKFTR
jgi:hypothetical protein